ncbi:MAG: RNA polymerase sigma factor [Prolixibacteraceae bacterium]|jgi:RNA polymerase sigma-70 factor (ECF subfamily)|nr:RNA polymerase sigma factor [Prolixibacteraceae bacterium]
MDDRQFIEQIKQGNEAAFRQLVEQHQKIVVNTCFSLVHNADDADDLAQEVFIEAFNSAQNFRGESKVSTWLYRIAVNKSLNFIRDNKKRKFFKRIEDVFFGRNYTNSEAGLSSEEPDQNLQEKQKAVILHKAIDSLPENQRIAFTLNKYEDLSYKEISDVMNVSLASVESLIHRAKKNLQEKLYDCYKKDC